MYIYIYISIWYMWYISYVYIYRYNCITHISYWSTYTTYWRDVFEDLVKEQTLCNPKWTRDDTMGQNRGLPSMAIKTAENAVEFCDAHGFKSKSNSSIPQMGFKFQLDCFLMLKDTYIYIYICIYMYTYVYIYIYVYI